MFLDWCQRLAMVLVVLPASPHASRTHARVPLPRCFAARLLLPLTFRLHVRGLALAFTFAREAMPSFPSRRLEGHRPAEPRQGQPTELAHPCNRPRSVVEWEDSFVPNLPLLR